MPSSDHHMAFRRSEEHTLRSAFAETSVGRLLVVISEHGVVDVILDDSLREIYARSQAIPKSGFFPYEGFARTGWLQW